MKLESIEYQKYPMPNQHYRRVIERKRSRRQKNELTGKKGNATKKNIKMGKVGEINEFVGKSFLNKTLEKFSSPFK